MLIFYLLVLTGFVPLPRSLVRFKLPNRSFQYSVTFKHYSYASNSDTKNTIFHKDDNISFKDLIRTSKQRRDFTQALKLADHMSSNLQSISTANITGIIQVYGEAGKLGDAVNILRKMELLKMAPNEYHLSALIQACRKVGQWEMALGLYERLPMYGIKENHVISNCMLSTLIEASQYSVAYEIFDRMKMLGIHSVFSYSILMSAFEREGKWEKAIEVYEGMGRDNIQPNTVIFNSVLKACLRHGQFQRVFDLFNKSSSRVPSDAITYSLVITALGQLGDFNAAYKLFQSLVQYQPTTPKPSVVSVDGQTPVAAPVLDTGVYNAMLVVCSKVGRWQECLSIINQLKPPSMIRADARSFATVISCCGKALRWRDALDLYHQLSVQGTYTYI